LALSVVIWPLFEYDSSLEASKPSWMMIRRPRRVIAVTPVLRQICRFKRKSCGNAGSSVLQLFQSLRLLTRLALKCGEADNIRQPRKVAKQPAIARQEKIYEKAFCKRLGLNLSFKNPADNSAGQRSGQSPGSTTAGYRQRSLSRLARVSRSLILLESPTLQPHVAQ
jgi:hypothetical protein